MERPKLSAGLCWRKKEDSSYFECIYFKKQYRGRRIRGSSGTNDPQEAERRLRRRLDEIDQVDIYGRSPDRTFREAAIKLIEEFDKSASTLRIYAQQADILDKFIGDIHLRKIYADTLIPFKEARLDQGVSAKTINLGIEFVKLVLRKAAHYWRTDGIPWIEHCPSIPFVRGTSKKPFPLSWEAQEKFFDNLPGRYRRMCLFDVNTGLRDRTLVNLQWSWERFEESLDETVFDIPGEFLKNGKPMVLVLNRLARQALDGMRGYHPVYVFGGQKQSTNSVWQLAWREAGLPTGREYCKGVHNLRHTFAKRLRDAGVDERDVQNLLHHVPKNLTQHYSSPELRNLKSAVERIVPKIELVGTKVPQAVS